MIAIFHALIDWGAGVHAVPRHTQLFRVSSPSSLQARFANGTLDTSAGRASLPLVASSQPTIPIVFEFITGSEFIIAPGLLQDHGVGFYAEPVPKGRAWLIFAALSPPLFVRLERRGAVFFARLAIVELPHGAGRVLRLLSAPGTESSAGSARDPVGVSAIDNIAAVNRLAWYLVATLETHVLCFRKSDGILRALMDASLANDNSLKSWYGFSTTLGENTGVIAFRSALARSIVASTRDSELLACLHCTYRVFSLRLFLAEIGLQQVAPTPMGSDAMAVLQGVSVKTVHRDSRWSAIRFAVIKQAMEDLLISCYHLPGAENGSDIYTKILPPALHFKHAMNQLGWPASAARDIAMLEQVHHDSVLMVRHNAAAEATAIGFVDESDLTPSVAALFK